MSDTLSAEDEARMEQVARAAGLDLVLVSFRADLRKAFLASEQLRHGLTGDLSPADEPWPPMHVDGSR